MSNNRNTFVKAHVYQKTLLTYLVGSVLFFFTSPAMLGQEPESFRLVEATIGSIHNAIKTNQTTCSQLTQLYINRAKAYNGICTQLVTEDGVSLPPSTGVMSAGSSLKFPTETVAISRLLPNYDEYQGLPFDFGRMESTLSDPSIQQQYGMRVGISNAGQLNALETLNIRGERSVTCKGKFDAHPSSGPLPEGAPEVCEDFRKRPDALERAAELDAQYGTAPDLENLPLYCIPFSFKNWYDAMDMRGTGGNDVNFDMDVPAIDSVPVAQVRKKGAIIYAIATASNNRISLSPSSTIPVVHSPPNTPDAKVFSPAGSIPGDRRPTTSISTWGGQPCNPYDTERETRGTSSGSGVSVAANLVVCSICEQTFASCQGPASRNNIVNFLTTKGVNSDGGILARKIDDRAGIHCRTVEDTVRVLDAIKGYEPREYFTAIPKRLIPEEPYTSFLISEADLAETDKPLEGMRIGIVREYMVKHSRNDVAISDQIDQEIKTILRNKLGAQLVESVDPLYSDDPDVPNMKYTFQNAIAEIFPMNVPEYFFRTTSLGDLEFAVPGFDVRTKDYLVQLALGKAPLSDNFNIRRLTTGFDNTGRGHFNTAKYLAERGDQKVFDWASWIANEKVVADSDRRSAEKAVDVQDLRPTNGIDMFKMQTVMRVVIQKVMYENGIDAFVNPENTLPHRKIGNASEPTKNDRSAVSCCGRFTAFIGIPQIVVPAGYNRVVYEPEFALSPDKNHYTYVSGKQRSLLPHPMPVSMMMWSGPGEESTLIKIASAYEAATKHRVPPSSFGPLPGGLQ
ncbi:MAG: amidase family protein [Acidobacteriota bacterium]|nr:amidase family protein [Acidobacteriota bacterium]